MIALHQQDLGFCIHLTAIAALPLASASAPHFPLPPGDAELPPALPWPSAATGILPTPDATFPKRVFALSPRPPVQ